VKLRREARGLHFYDRKCGLHVLFDECPVPPDNQDEGPATISIALTNRCDLSCAFCYAPKSRHTLAADDVVRWCRKLSAMGTLEVAFGGGEPTLFPELPQLCRTIWSETGLGVSVTTHGQHLTDELVKGLQGSVSVIRVSIDAVEPQYSSMRGRPMQLLVENVKRLADRIPLGINSVINSTTLQHLDDLAGLVKILHAVDWLLLPEVHQGEFTLTGSEWQTLDHWIAKRRLDFELRVTAEAAQYLSGPFLLQDRPEDYAHISADGYLRRCSYRGGGVALREHDVLTALRELREQERCRTCAQGSGYPRLAVFQPWASSAITPRSPRQPGGRFENPRLIQGAD
jgi:MoaA/NifB/PqqE/SkfB family radical SAM enzyme